MAKGAPRVSAPSEEEKILRKFTALEGFPISPPEVCVVMLLFVKIRVSV